MMPGLVKEAVCPTVGIWPEPMDPGFLDAEAQAHGVHWLDSRKSCGSGPHGPIRNRGLLDGGLIAASHGVAAVTCCDTFCPV